jgi:hypothetical protein
MSEKEDIHPFFGIPLGSSLLQVEENFNNNYGVSLKLENEDETSASFVTANEMLLDGLKCSIRFNFAKSDDGEMILSSADVLFYTTIMGNREEPSDLKKTFEDGLRQFVSIYGEYAEDYEVTGIYTIRYPVHDGGNNIINQYESLDDVINSDITKATSECDLVTVVALFNNIAVQGMWSNANTTCMWVMRIEYADEQQACFESN